MIKDIQVFLSFANFYCRFIYDFNKIGGLHILMLKTTQSGKNLLSLMAKNDKVDSNCSNCDNKTIKKLQFKNLNRAIKYLTPKARIAFTQLKKHLPKLHFLDILI